jgi:hypothetical protein
MLVKLLELEVEGEKIIFKDKSIFSDPNFHLRFYRRLPYHPALDLVLRVHGRGYVSLFDKMNHLLAPFLG